MTVYPTETQRTTGGALPYTLRKAIGTIKETVPIATAANDLGAELRPSGEDLRGKGVCHGGDNETALLVDPDEGRYYCFRCNEGGDVIDLCRAVEGGEVWEAVVSLALRYGVDLPRRPQRWHSWNGEKGKRHDALRKVRARLYQRRFLRMFRADLEAIPDPKEREEEARRVYEDLYPLSYACAIYREGAARG